MYLSMYVFTYTHACMYAWIYVYICILYSYRSGSVKTPHLQTAHQLLKAEPLQMPGTKQNIVELPLQPKKDFIPQMVTATSSNFPSGSKYHKKHVPKYTAPFPSPTTSQPSSPVVRNEKKSTGHTNQPLLSSTSKQVKGQIYDLNKMAGAIANTNNTTNESSGKKFKRRNDGWWSCLSLPSSNHSTIIGTYITGAANPCYVDSSATGVTVTHDAPPANLTTPMTANNITATLSPRTTSPTNVSPLGASKNRTTRYLLNYKNFDISVYLCLCVRACVYIGNLCVLFLAIKLIIGIMHF